MPSTEGMNDKLKEAGTQGRRAFMEGFSGGGGSPDKMGSEFGEKFMAGFSRHMQSGNFGALGSVFDKLGAQVDEKLAARLKNQLPESYRAATTAANELRDAEERLAHATEALNDRTKTADMTAYVAALREKSQATKDIEAATTRASKAQGDYSEKMDQFNAASARSVTMASTLGGLVGGSLVLGFQMLTGAMEGVIHLGEEVFDGALHGAEELTEKLIEAGEGFEQISNQVTEFSGLSGPALDELKDHAAAVFGTLDVAGQDVGKTMSELSSRLHMEPGQALDDLTRKVEDLGGRFKTLKPESIATIFTDFGIGADQANASLDTLVQNAQNAGVDMGQLTTLMAGPVSETLKEAGLNFGQAAHVVALMSQQGIPATDVVRGLGSAMKLFAKDGLSFKDGLAEARKELQQLGDTAQGNALANSLFGTKWADAVKITQDLNDTLDQTPDKFDGAAGAADNLINSTEDLDNRIQELKNKAATAFKPFEEGAINALDNGLDRFKTWFDQNRDMVIDTVTRWGKAFIDIIPDIKAFADVFLLAMQALAPPLEGFTSMILYAAAGIKLMSGDFEESKKLFDEANKFALHDPIGDAIDKLKPKIDGMFDDAIKNSDKLKQKLDEMGDAAKNMYVPPPQGFSWWNDYSSPDFQYPNTPGQPGGQPNGGFAAHPHAPGVTVPGPRAPFAAPGPQGTPGAPNPLAPTDQPSGYDIPHRALWQRVAQAESTGNWSNADTGHNGHYGGLQFAPSTWNMFGGQQFAAMPQDATPEQQMIVAERTAFTGWGGNPPQGLGAWETITNGSVQTTGYAGGGMIGLGLFKGVLDSLGMVGGGNGGIDDVLIRATAGEFVMNREASQKYRPLLEILNGTRGYATGGQVVDQFGVNIAGAQVDTIRIADALAQIAPGHTEYLYRSPDGFDEHSSGEAVDFMVGDDIALGNSVKNWALQQPGVMYALWQQTQWNPDGSSSPMEDRGGATANHRDHVHIRTVGGGYPPGMGPNETGLAFGKYPAGTQMSGGSMGGGGFGAMSASFATGAGAGGGGAFGGPGMGGGTGGFGQTPDEQREHQRAIERAHDRITNVNREIQDKTDEITRLQKQLDTLNSEPDLQRNADQAKIDSTKRQLQRAKEDLDKLKNQDLREANEDLDDANRKANEPGRAGRRGGRGREDGSYDAAQELGRGLLSGIFEELGIPNVFGGKSPLDWGSMKLGMGLLNWGMGTLNAMGSGSGGGNPLGALALPSSGGQFPISPSSLSLVPPTATGLGAPGSPHGKLPGPAAGNQTVIHNATFDQSQTWHVNPSTDKEITQAVSNYSISHDHNQQVAAAPGTFAAT